MIKPIQTYYKGYKFRSGLEARWAVFFDALGIEWEYEPEGYVGCNDKAYLPDFYFPKYGIYAEVKGSEERLLEDAGKIWGCIEYQTTPIEKGLILLGKIPNPEKDNRYGYIPMFPFAYWHEGVVTNWAVFDIFGISYNSDYDNPDDEATGFPHSAEAMYGVSDWVDCWSGEEDMPEKFNLKQKYCGFNGWVCAKAPVELYKAYDKARQARFEHGETP